MGIRPGGRPFLWEGGEVSAGLTQIPTHPLIGRKTPLAHHLPGVLEQTILREEGVNLSDLDRIPQRGTRRGILAFPLETFMEGDWLVVTLPPGTYATVFLETLGYRVTEGEGVG